MDDRRLPAPLFVLGLITIGVALVALMFIAWRRDDLASAKTSPSPSATSVTAISPWSSAASTPSPAAPTPRSLPTATVSPTPTQSGTPVLDLPPLSVHDASFVTYDQSPWQYGSTIAYWGGPARDRSIQILDVATTATMTVLGSEGDAGYILDYNGDSVTWLRSIFPGNLHANHWQIRRYGVASGVLNVIAQGVNHWITDDNYVHDPYVAFDGDLVAYDVETLGPDKKARILVQSISSGELVRTIDVGGPVFDIGLSGADVTYLTGDVSDPPWSPPDYPQLILSPANGPPRQLPYQESVPIAFDENGVAVTEVFADPTSAVGDLTFTTPVGATTTYLTDPRELLHDDGLVVWRSRKLAEGDGQFEGDQVSIYDTDTHRIAVLDAGVDFERGISDVAGLDDGWLLWISEDENSSSNDGYHLTAYAVRTSDVHAAFDALADGQ